MDIERYSSYKKLLRVTSYVQRFIRNCRGDQNSRSTGYLKPNEIQKSAETWIRNCQDLSFPQEYNTLKSQVQIQNKLSRIRQLRLFIDDKNRMRSGGRINNAPLSDDAKFPYILPNKHTLSKLIVMDAHERLFHSGVSATITQVRQSFWIPAIRELVRTVLKKCVTCRKVIGQPYSAPDPPPLPKIRLQDAAPFTATGIDFTGASNVKTKDNRLAKSYICLFTCASTRAVHLEVMSDLTEKTFLKAFRRFPSRKSLPKIVMTDNATTFVSASEEVKRLCNSQSLKEEFATHGINWYFIPKRAQWFGGWWERLIGLTKTSLKKVLGRSLVDLDTLQTIVTEIESILNDRPFTYISSDPEDLEPLTPAHLLYGRRINSLPYPKTIDIEMENETVESNIQNISKRSQRQSLLLQQFWNRWRTEYLTSLRETHTKIGTNFTRISIGDMVQIHDETRRIHWKTGIVEQLIKGNNGLVRSAIVRTNSGTTSRPIAKLYPLEICSKGDTSNDELDVKLTTRRSVPNREAALRAKNNIRQWTKCN